MQNLGVGGGGGQIRCIMGNVEVAYKWVEHDHPGECGSE